MAGTVKGGVGGNGDGTTTLNYDWNYEYVYDWTLGKELNDPWPFNASVVSMSMGFSSQSHDVFWFLGWFLNNSTD